MCANIFEQQTPWLFCLLCLCISSGLDISCLVDRPLHRGTEKQMVGSPLGDGLWLTGMISVCSLLICLLLSIPPWYSSFTLHQPVSSELFPALSVPLTAGVSDAKEKKRKKKKKYWIIFLVILCGTCRVNVWSGCAKQEEEEEYVSPCFKVQEDTIICGWKKAVSSKGQKNKNKLRVFKRKTKGTLQIEMLNK